MSCEYSERPMKVFIRVLKKKKTQAEDLTLGIPGH